MTLLRRLWSVDTTPCLSVAMCALVVSSAPRVNHPGWAVYDILIGSWLVVLSSFYRQPRLARAAWLLSGLAYLVAATFLLARVGP